MRENYVNKWKMKNFGKKGKALEEKLSWEKFVIVLKTFFAIKA